jgi:hypothetical protein
MKPKNKEYTQLELLCAVIDSLGPDDVRVVRDRANARLTALDMLQSKNVVIHYRIREDGTLEHAKIIYDSLEALKRRYSGPQYEFTCVARQEYKPPRAPDAPAVMELMKESLSALKKKARKR